ncbi:MAG: diguanylate cyclase [Paracoccaceae bacterium]|nr:MAG: diguanylate cyclase [Paracoccaceae bacterium]
MDGRVLIIGGSAAARIMLKARLSATCHGITSLAEGAKGLACAAAGEHDAILVHQDLPDIPAPELVRRLRACAPRADMPVLVIGDDGGPEARIAAFEAGADDVIRHPDEALLAARLRSLLRHRDTLAELGANAEPVRGFGFAEADTGFAARADIVLVMERGEAALHLRRDLAVHLPQPPRVMTAAEALGDPQYSAGCAGPDLYVIHAAPQDTDSALRLMSELRSRAAGRHAAFCLLRSGSDAAIDPVGLDLGAGDLVDTGTDPREVALRLRRVLVRKLAADRLRASVRDGLRLAVTDPLTGLHNRRYAVRELAAMAEAAHEKGSTLAILILDLDRFKRVNDDWGHAAGDAVLIEVARRLGGALRGSDLIARIGGEEFLVALPDTALPEARRIAERLCDVIQARPVMLPAAQPLRITASIGLAVADLSGAGIAGSFQALLDRADRALLAAKSAGRNQVTVARSAA